MRSPEVPPGLAGRDNQTDPVGAAAGVVASTTALLDDGATQAQSSGGGANGPQRSAPPTAPPTFPPPLRGSGTSASTCPAATSVTALPAPAVVDFEEEPPPLVAPGGTYAAVSPNSTGAGKVDPNPVFSTAGAVLAQHPGGAPLSVSSLFGAATSPEASVLAGTTASSTAPSGSSPSEVMASRGQSPAAAAAAAAVAAAAAATAGLVPPRPPAPNPAASAAALHASQFLAQAQAQAQRPCELPYDRGSPYDATRLGHGDVAARAAYDPGAYAHLFEGLSAYDHGLFGNGFDFGMYGLRHPGASAYSHLTGGAPWIPSLGGMPEGYGASPSISQQLAAAAAAASSMGGLGGCGCGQGPAFKDADGSALGTAAMLSSTLAAAAPQTTPRCANGEVGSSSSKDDGVEFLQALLPNTRISVCPSSQGSMGFGKQPMPQMPQMPTHPWMPTLREPSMPVPSSLGTVPPPCAAAMAAAAGAPPQMGAGFGLQPGVPGGGSAMPPMREGSGCVFNPAAHASLGGSACGRNARANPDKRGGSRRKS